MTAEVSTSTLHAHDFRVDCTSRARLLDHDPAVLWFTGISGAGKSTIANEVETRLHATRRLTYVLDGDSVRLGLCKDLGFTDTDRHENIRRVAEVARLMADAGVVVLVCFISPFRADREIARTITGPHKFGEIHVYAPLEIAEARDPKGLYRLARRGVIQNFTGIDSPYEPPENPDVFINTESASVESAAEAVLKWLASR
ncbi:adenylyl-sulfate kinase [Paraburkholderia sp. SIMBA_027]|uniref:adenylyl-sulfate kinase n=1 Tax=Paraburkholderia sp. SIMBA_027 TaxID=3085770 RepID=UPI00397B342C